MKRVFLNAIAFVIVREILPLLRFMALKEEDLE